MNVFISYNHRDEDKALKLEEDLKLQHVGIWIDKGCIEPGTIWLKEIDEGLSIRQVDYVLGIVTNDYINSTGGIEAYAKISEGLRKRGRDIKFIPLFFEDINKINSVITAAIQGFKFYEDYNKGLLELIKFLKSKESEQAAELLSKIEGENSKNPFRRTRAEFFESDSKLAMAFADPEKERYELVCGRMPLFIFGGRGSGKTMILRSLTPEVITSRLRVKTLKEAKEKGVDYFGIYIRLMRGSLSLADNNTILKLGFLNLGVVKDYNSYKELWKKIDKDITDEPIISSGINSAQIIFLNEINLKILKAIVAKLKHLQDIKVISIDNDTEQEIVSLIIKRLNPSLVIRSFNDLMGFIDTELDKIKDYLQKITLPFNENISANWVTSSPDFIDCICKIFVDNLMDLKGTKFYLLLDEFENLLPYQQMIINEWVKTSNNIVVKVGVKYEGMHTNMTLQGQLLQFKVGECDEIALDYDLFDDIDIAKYQNLLKRICEKLLLLEKYNETDIEKILEKPSASELPPDVIDECIKEIAGNRFQEKAQEYREKFEVAAIFRLLRKKEKVEGRRSRKKVYAGFDTYTYLSSGIIRIFLNLVGMALYRAEGNKINVKAGQNISIEDQSWASRIVSKAYLEKIYKNVESYRGINGEIIYQFVTDIGDIFRERLLFHSSEPETLSISVRDPHNLDKKEFSLLKDLFKHGAKESIFYKREETSSYRPKQSAGIRTKDYVLNRVYTPALEISHRARWGRCKFSVEELSELITSKTREKIKRTLQQRQRKEEEQEKTPLFDEE